MDGMGRLWVLRELLDVQWPVAVVVWDARHLDVAPAGTVAAAGIVWEFFAQDEVESRIRTSAWPGDWSGGGDGSKAQEETGDDVGELHFV